MSALPTEPWFHPLLEPVRTRVEAAWRSLPPGMPEGNLGIGPGPRAGLGGAVVVHVARGWGTRRWQEAGRVGIAL
ncbi:MAG: hypothetical protein Q7U06_02220, partial [Pseudomonadota bacterium]|nr:hypothetical protein [Pseudomonadota bacterium]